jgi:hypothetical protein
VRRGQRGVAGQELGVLAGEDVVGDDAEAKRIAQRAAQREDQRSLAAADRPPDADGEGAPREIAIERRIAIGEPTRMIPVLVVVIVRVRMVMVTRVLMRVVVIVIVIVVVIVAHRRS